MNKPPLFPPSQAPLFTNPPKLPTSKILKLWQRYVSSSKQQKIVLPIGIVIVGSLIIRLISTAVGDITGTQIIPITESTYTATSLPNTITPTLTLLPTFTPTITDTPTITFTATETFTPTITFTPTVTNTPTLTLPVAIGADCVPITNERVRAKVVRITDGDTIVVSIEGVEYKLRYIGMDAPEATNSGGSQSTYYNRQLLEGKTVTLVKDVSETDRYDRLLRYVFVGNIFVNYEMVRAGYASSGSWPPDTSCDQVLTSAFNQAKANKIGLWAPTVTPLPYVPLIIAPKPTSATAGGKCDPSYPTVCIPPPPPDLDCKDVPYKRFQVLSPDPHNFDADHDGIGCES